MGRRKIEIKKIEESSKRQVTFSKRRSGLFRKTADICRLFDAEAAIVTFSTKRCTPYVFAHPNPDTVFNRFFDQISNNDSHFVEKEEADEEEESEDWWWEKASVDDMELEGLLKLKAALSKMKRRVDRLANHMEMQTLLPQGNHQGPVFGGGERGGHNIVDCGDVPDQGGMVHGCDQRECHGHDILDGHKSWQDFLGTAS